MTTPDSIQSVDELIASVGDRLTPTERRIAQEVSSDPSLLVFGTVSDLAERADTSRRGARPAQIATTWASSFPNRSPEASSNPVTRHLSRST